MVYHYHLYSVLLCVITASVSVLWCVITVYESYLAVAVCTDATDMAYAIIAINSIMSQCLESDLLPSSGHMQLSYNNQTL